MRSQKVCRIKRKERESLCSIFFCSGSITRIEKRRIVGRIVRRGLKLLGVCRNDTKNVSRQEVELHLMKREPKYEYEVT